MLVSYGNLSKFYQTRKYLGRNRTVFDIIVKAAGFVFIIILGMFSRRIGLLKKDDSRILSKIIVTFTLPCALISGFGGITFSALTFITLLLGFLCDMFLMMTGKFLARNQSPSERANAMICTSGYNIGAFVVPFCQSFFSPEILSYIIMFDIRAANFLPWPL